MTRCRQGLGAGMGSGYHNIIPKDPKVHSDSAHGRKQPQRIITPLTSPQVKVPVKYIEIMRAEGSFDDDANIGKTQRFSSFEEADKRLREISQTAPKGGAYDKTDVKVVWENGDEYKGRWDVKHYSEPNNDTSIRPHIRESLEFYAGENERGKKWIESYGVADKEVQESKKMLKTLNLGDNQVDDRVNDVQVNEEKLEPLKESDLMQFTGTEKYHRWSPLFRNTVATDGVMYVAEKGEAHWLLDAVASWQSNPKVKREEFQVWELTRTKGNEAILTAEDGNGHKIAQQKIPYTDFPLKKIKFFLRNNVIMLPREY